MAKHDKFSALTAAQKLQRRQGEVKQSVKEAVGDAAPRKPKKVARTKKAPPLSEIKKTKHKGLEGEPSYGQRINPPAVGPSKTRFGQTGD